MERLYNIIDCDYKTLSPLTLAFIGDAVYDLLIREQLVCKANCPVGKLHKMKVTNLWDGTICLTDPECITKNYMICRRI